MITEYVLSEFVNQGQCRTDRDPAKLVFDNFVTFHKKCICCEPSVKAVLKRAKNMM